MHRERGGGEQVREVGTKSKELGHILNKVKTRMEGSHAQSHPMPPLRGSPPL